MQNLLIKTLGNRVLKMEARFISLKQSDISQDSSSQYFAFQSQKQNVDRVRKMTRVIGMHSLASMMQSENIDLKFEREAKQKLLALQQEAANQESKLFKRKRVATRQSAFSDTFQPAAISKSAMMSTRVPNTPKTNNSLYFSLPLADHSRIKSQNLSVSRKSVRKSDFNISQLDNAQNLPLTSNSNQKPLSPTCSSLPLLQKQTPKPKPPTVILDSSFTSRLSESTPGSNFFITEPERPKMTTKPKFQTGKLLKRSKFGEGKVTAQKINGTNQEIIQVAGEGTNDVFEL
ncbi:Hypothetical_protein [Hexamita inflata]|uniref:Hypothetical_protein n=1 Tax=Hexamita inflata TaxID=28002 RepID=A0AA86PUZ8_9EUKA|nr:Hypothetical protein HINF_LOCUS34071 [Hexamita inflata]